MKPCASTYPGRSVDIVAPDGARPVLTINWMQSTESAAAILRLFLRHKVAVYSQPGSKDAARIFMCVIEPTIRHLPTIMPTKIHHSKLHEIAEKCIDNSIS
jgi:hypothetical protein